MSDAQERKANPLKSFIGGGVGGVCTVVTGHPLDTIKVNITKFRGSKFSIMNLSFFLHACRCAYKPCRDHHPVSNPCIRVHSIAHEKRLKMKVIEVYIRECQRL